MAEATIDDSAARYPDLICIGAQKAGTTWLHRVLLDHPRIFAPVFKEVHYFDSVHVRAHRNFHQRRARRSRQILAGQIERTVFHAAAAAFAAHVLQIRTARRYVGEHRFAARMGAQPVDDAWYAGLFAAARPDQIACDFTPAYALLPPAGIAHMRRLCPQARIVYLLRDPVERALSHARMLVVRHGLPRESGELQQFLDGAVVRAHDDCLAVIERWEAAWPQDRFKVFFYDDIARRPLELLREVCDFADLPFEPHRFRRMHDVVYKGPGIPATPQLRAALAERYAPLFEGLHRRFPAQTANWGLPRQPVARLTA